MSELSQAKARPVGVTVLAVLAGIAAVLAAWNALQFLGIIPFFIGPVAFRTFNFWYALMWGLMVWVYIWLVQMLWRVDRQAWLFLVIITTFELILNFTAMLGSATWQDVSVSFLFNAAVLIYCMLPGVKSAFDIY
jgi:The Golgi pH Regulator (GPHR) Family N-terminal